MGVSLGVVIPIYIRGVAEWGFIIRDATKEALYKCRNKKVKLDFLEP